MLFQVYINHGSILLMICVVCIGSSSVGYSAFRDRKHLIFYSEEPTCQKLTLFRYKSLARHIVCGWYTLIMKTFHPAIAARLFPRETAWRNIAFVILAAALTAVCAQASIPVYPVPITLQTMAVTLAGLTLGWRLAMWSQVTYIAAGCANMPVFANGEFGIAKLIGPTGGYLVAFIFAAGFLGYVSERRFIRNALDLTSALIAANFIILAFGTAWLAWYVPQGTAMNLGFYPFLIGALVKSLVVVAMLPAAKRLVKPR